MTPKGELTHFSPALKEALAKIKEGVTGLAAGSNALYVASPSSIFRVELGGNVTPIARPAVLKDCDDDLPPNSHRPGFRGLCVSTNGVVIAAATGCRRVIRITASGEVSVVTKSEAPWNPTDVALHGTSVYVLEWTNANGGPDDGWRPRVRRVDADGAVKTLVEIKENVIVPKSPVRK